MTRLVLFDIDGTLILTGGAGSKALARACFALHGWHEALRDIHLGGKTDPLIVDEIFQRHLGRGATAAEFDALIAAYVPLLADEVAASSAYRVLPGVHAAIAACAAAGAVLGLATGNVADAARVKLARADLWSPFAFGGFGSDAADRGELVACAIRRGQTHASRAYAPDEVLVIGDTRRDIAAARRNGARVIAVATGSESLAELADADLALPSLLDLPTHLPSFL